jgi:arylsulfatase A-like enzyme
MRPWLLFFGWLTVAGFLCAAERPNVVLIMADDLGYETVGCYGGHAYGTPNIDRLASNGIRFDRAYSMPLCTNTRIQLMTSKYNNRNWRAFGILDPREQTFGHLMQQAGYKTCIAGKWQLTSYDPPDYPGADLRRNTGMHPRDAGFDEYSLWHVGHTEDKGSRYADPVIEQNGKPLSGTRGKYGPDVWTDFINDFMERHRDEPFFVYYSMALPHNPMTPTPDTTEWRDPQLRSRDETRFAADMIRYTDKMVGKVVAKLDDLGLRERTLVLFFSDNGTNWRVRSKFGDKLLRGGKGKGTELGIRVPAVANWPGTTPAGQVVTDLIDSTDFLPTILDVAGAAEQIAEPIDGISFAPRLRGHTGTRRDWVYIHQDPRPGWDKDRFNLLRLAVGRRYKLYEDGRLFDLKQDPFENSPIEASRDTEASRVGRVKLQAVLDGMKPYPMFDPESVPRPDPHARFRRHAFQDDGGFVVIEAEMLPTPRDESWVTEKHLDGFTGVGYLRAVRDQPVVPDKGETPIAVILDTAGPWQLAVRCRSDHVSGAAEHEFWIKVNGGDWLVGSVAEAAETGAWTWATIHLAFGGETSTAAVFQLQERHNTISIAPRSANVKIDRVVLFQSDRRAKALNLSTPVSDYHPWASP